MVNAKITITNPSNNNTFQYLLIIFNSLLALLHFTLKPYGSNILNVFDGFVLQMMIMVSMAPLVDSLWSWFTAIIYSLISNTTLNTISADGNLPLQKDNQEYH